MLLRTLDWLMAALLAFAAVLQYNDPDPVRWVLMYGIAALFSAAAARRHRLHPAGPATLGILALVAAIVAARDVPLTLYARMFDAWEMKSLPVEEARESCGLLIIAAWMAVLAVRGWSRRPR